MQILSMLRRKSFPLNCLPFPVHVPIGIYPIKTICIHSASHSNRKRPAPDATLLLYKQVLCDLIDPRSLNMDI
ncbi:hypothetical protein EYC80_003422 [Monilinia laxa]|uniref:Uncharacterized protein n=1 Tax=Monilinia laxa TaxID=61186 RepID=A0A5N6KDY9_MONLA|nr:hypothetical protein EYC80_003422 [Monilinia laxa]